MTPAAPAERGYAVLYRSPQACPGYGRGNWHVGRESAECACCGTALALAPETRAPMEIDRFFEWEGMA